MLVLRMKKNEGANWYIEGSSEGASNIKTLKICGCQTWSSNILRVPGTHGNRANTSPDKWSKYGKW